MGAMTYSIDDIERLLVSGADRPVEIAAVHHADADAEADSDRSDEMPFTHLDHALQTAAVLREWVPDDDVLVLAGLVHDIGHLLAGVGDAAHALAGARVVRAALGERIASLVGLHVEAKRYLVARQGAYAGELSADSVVSLALQGGPMSAEEQLAFAALSHAQDALTLRRADESGKIDGLVVPELGEWMDVMRQLSR
jgi:predicted HD phosphohydrolase